MYVALGGGGGGVSFVVPPAQLRGTGFFGEDLTGTWSKERGPNNQFQCLFVCDEPVHPCRNRGVVVLKTGWRLEACSVGAW